MSRSNNSQQQGPNNPCNRWHEWSGARGSLNYYDKDTKQKVELGDQFTFMLLDELAVIKGWHEASQSGITSNEVRSTGDTQLVVRAFKGGELCRGFYKDIKDKVLSVGGHYFTSLYIAYYDDNQELQIGNIQLKGAALRAWMDFKNNNKGGVLYQKAISIHGTTEGKKGAVKFKVPVFKLRDVSDETQAKAVALDAQVQEYLKAYLSVKQEPAPVVGDLDGDDIDF